MFKPLQAIIVFLTITITTSQTSLIEAISQLNLEKSEIRKYSRTQLCVCFHLTIWCLLEILYTS